MTAAVYDSRFADDAKADRADDYRRQARRLRHTFRCNPIKLHRSLRYLSACHDIASHQSHPQAAAARVFNPCMKAWVGNPCYKNDDLPEYVIDQTSHTIRNFANDVAKSMRGPILSYSQRLILMRKAKQIGLRPFDANLIIAAVQHRVNETLGVEESTKPTSWRFAMIIGALLQLGIVAGAWWILR